MQAISSNSLGQCPHSFADKSGGGQKVFRFNQFSTVAARKNHYIDRNGTGTTNIKRTAAAAGIVNEAKLRVEGCGDGQC